MCGVALDDKTYVLTFNTLAGAGGFAKPRSKQQSAGLLLAAFGRPTCSNPTSSSTKKDPQPQSRISFGGSWWIRTTEALSSRFTVCPHWPLGKAPIFSLLPPCLPATYVIIAEGFSKCKPFFDFFCDFFKKSCFHHSIEQKLFLTYSCSKRTFIIVV